ncbi:MAG: family 78 glycoside hydrolase catalytic domain [Aeromicrobium sp.]
MSITSHFIAPDQEFDGAPLLRREVRLDAGHGAVSSATLQLSALGVCEAWINGQPVSQDVLTPGWSSFEWRRRFAEYDVTALVGGESLAIGVALGNGWHRGRLGWTGRSAFYGDELGAHVDLLLRFEDGHEQRVVTDHAWRAGASATTANELYDGQSIDARRVLDGWAAPGFDDGAWVGVHPVTTDATLEPYVGPAVRRQEELPVVETWLSPSGKRLVDFGQNLVGWLRVRVRGEAGTVITVRHAEVLENDELGTRPLRTAAATDRFTLSGGDDEFEPTFTFHGFRYAEIEGWPGDFDPAAVTAVVVHSDLRRTGTFRSSEPLLDKLHDNVVWGMRGNFLDVPTDCPQRDERLGWTGDIAAFAPTAVYLFDAQDFLRDWLRDLALEQQHQDGVVPYVVPDILKHGGMPEEFLPMDSTAVWSDAGVWVPWSIWQAYGDETVLAEQYDSMTAHVRRVGSLLSPTGLWDRGFQFGDWLDPDAPPENPAAAKADPGVVATICAYRSASLLATIATELGRTEDAAEFTALAGYKILSVTLVGRYRGEASAEVEEA